MLDEKTGRLVDKRSFWRAILMEQALRGSTLEQQLKSHTKQKEVVALLMDHRLFVDTVHLIKLVVDTDSFYSDGFAETMSGEAVHQNEHILHDQQI